MTQTIRRLGVLTTLLAAAGCLGAPEDPGAPEFAARVSPLGATTTVTTIVQLICGPSMSASFGVDATIPSFVAPGETFPVTFGLRFDPAILTLNAGVLDAAPEFEATRATPASVTLPYDSLSFPARSVVSVLGSETADFTATTQVGQPIQLSFPSIDYTITWAGTQPPLVAHCTVAETSSPLIATIPIVREPQAKADCKNGGFASFTDDTGKVFKNQGACVKYVNGA